MGEIEIQGKDAIAFVDYLITNRTTDMSDGDIRYSPMCYPHGGQVDDLLAYRVNAEKMLLVVNASNIQKDFDHIQHIRHEKKEMDLNITNLSHEYGQIAFQGPQAEVLLQPLCSKSLAEIKVFKFMSIPIAGIHTITSRTGYTGEDGFEILAKPTEIAKIWQAILDSTSHKGVKPCGLGSRDTLRFEACLWLYGNDIDASISPLEAGQNFAVKLDKPFVGREPIQKQKDKGIERTLCAMTLEGKQIPRHGMEIIHEDKCVGFISSGTYCPTIQKVASLGYLPTELSQAGKKVLISIRNNRAEATVVPKPFYKGSAGRKDRR